MFDDMIARIFDLHRNVLEKTKKDVTLTISPIVVKIIVFENNKILDSHCAYLYDDMPDYTKALLEHIINALTSMLEGGAADV